MTSQHRRIVRNLIIRGCITCVVCKGSVDVTDDLRIILLDSTVPRHMANMRLRHEVCQWSKYRPAAGATDLVELMIASPYKICEVCKVSWVGSELEELVVGLRGTDRVVLHKVCL
jgi:hypothetical protein